MTENNQGKNAWRMTGDRRGKMGKGGGGGGGS